MMRCTIGLGSMRGGMKAVSMLGQMVTVGLVLLPSMVSAYTGFTTYTNPTGKYK